MKTTTTGKSVQPDIKNTDSDPFAEQRKRMNQCRFTGHEKGHYESYFLRANHPERPLGFWIRYTLFAPKGNPQANIGELWVIVFDGETDQIRAAKAEYPLANCRFDRNGLDVQIGAATLRPGLLEGEVKNDNHHIQWQLNYRVGDEPVFLLPENLYEKSLPKAKALVANPNAVFSGHLLINGETLHVEEWKGSENHNWGSKHTDEYAWGQVAGFDNAPDGFLEVATARLKFGPVWTPRMTTLVLRLEGKTYSLNSLLKAPFVNAHYGYFHWHFDTSDHGVRIVGDIQAPREYFVGLNYYNPPGGSHTCLNCKIASARILLQEPGKPVRELLSHWRAAFEILTDDVDHGIAVVA